MKKISKKKLIVIDGHAIFFRSYYAMERSQLMTTKGEPIGAVHGFYKMLYKMITSYHPDYFIIIFDAPGINFRNELYADYKANRKETPDDLKYQLGLTIDCIKHLEIPYFIPEGVEADDGIASLVHKYRNEEDLDIVVVSGDKDLYNLLYENVVMLRPKKGVTEFKTITALSIEEELGVDYKKIPDYMAITGDTSDNIPGVKGIGPKGASQLIQKYTTIENIYSNLEHISGNIQKKLEGSKEDCFLSKKLVTLKKDMVLDFKLKDLLWDNVSFNLDKLKCFQEKELKSVYDDWVNLVKVKPSPNEGQHFLKNTYLIQTKLDWDKIKNKIMTSKLVAMDTETTDLNPMNACLVGLSLSCKVNHEYISLYIPCIDPKVQLSYHEKYNSISKVNEVLSWLRAFFSSKKIIKIGQNLKYDLLVLKKYDIEVVSAQHDVMLYSFLLYPNQRKHNLDALALDFLSYKTMPFKELVGVGKKEIPITEVDLDKLAFYAQEDAEITYRLYEKIFEAFKNTPHLHAIYDQVDLPLMLVLLEMEYHGVYIDTHQVKQLEKEYDKCLKQNIDKIYALADKVFNINSTHELAHILFEHLHIKSTVKTSTGKLSTEHKVLESLKNEHEIIPYLLDYRALQKLLSTYIKPLPHYINTTTSRIHTSFSQIIAATGRLASTNPNLQNIPIKGKRGTDIRKIFIPENNQYELLSLDYNQIELRILAHYSSDFNLIQAYKSHQDIHDQATYLLFASQFNSDTCTWDETLVQTKHSLDIDTEVLKQMKKTTIFKDKRSIAKILNFSIVYGVTEWGLSKNLSISVFDARNLIEAYFHSFPRIKNYMDEAIDEAKEKGYVENLFTRRRYISGINSTNVHIRKASERLAINTKIQSTAADIIKKAMIVIQNKILEDKLKSKMLIQIHDELLFEVYKPEKDSFYEFVKTTMENIVKLKVPLKVDGNYGVNWHELK